MLLGVWGGFKNKVHTSLLGLIGLAVGLGIVGFATPAMMIPAIGGILVVGIMISITNGPINAVLQSVVDPAMQGRVFTLVGSLASAMSPLGLMIAGPISDLVSIQIWYIVGAIATLGFGIGGFFLKELVNLEAGSAKAD